MARHNKGMAEPGQSGEPAGADAATGMPAASDTEARPAVGEAAATAEHRSSPAARRGARADWRRGVRTGRGYAAKVVVWAALIVALILGIAAVLLGFGANEHNSLVHGVVSAARWLDGPFGDLFTFPDQIKQSIVNWVIAAVAYLAAGGILARLIRP